MRKEGRGKRDGEEGGTGRKEGRGERKNKKVVKKNEKVAKGRIIGLAGPCFSCKLNQNIRFTPFDSEFTVVK